jgi:dUTP pyrophosphatase
LIEIALKRLPHGEGLPVPSYATRGAAGLDVVAAESLSLAPGARHAVATGFALAIPEGFEVQVRPRSGLALKHGIMLPNSPATIDPDYRGELRVIVWNSGDAPVPVPRGMRIAQLVFARFEVPEIVEAEELSLSGRGTGGFGSTGH